MRKSNAITSKSASIEILNVHIDSISRFELLENLRLGGVVFTPNVDHLMKLRKDKEFRKAYQIADYKICDSEILFRVSKILRRPIREKISGADFLSDFYIHYKYDSRIKIFLLGSTRDTVEKAKNSINGKVRREMVVGCHSPSFGFENDEDENEGIIDLINQSSANVLVIGVGAPKQEKWILKYRHRLRRISIVLAIGAAIDFEAGSVQRAPAWVSNNGFEWLYRLIHEPKRLWKRYLLDDIGFIGLIGRDIALSYWRKVSMKNSYSGSLKRDLSGNHKPW